MLITGSKSMKQAAVRLLRAHRPLARKHKPLLPPLQLYRRILREHKSLPLPQRELGDQYVKNEFRLHRETTNPLYIVGFLASWQDYLHMITKGDWVEGTLSAQVLEKMSPEQVGQLYELMKETEGLRKDGQQD
ncbi:LAFE_0G01376g1_1 [Lachancea fermentati]|uniref:Succinate dehydrogenase assembly factor 3 n=1 Tax=Lachancea fermentati TaxID=4955 RepID=A0A1G4MGR9_LACFM|nr:LAFE_0G01376g1_1 [Lachancea fermentati]